MTNLVICSDCGGMIRGMYECIVCGKKRGKVEQVEDIKSFLGVTYYWYDCIEKKLGKDFFKYIDSFGKEGVIFTKNKHRGSGPSRHWRIKKYSKLHIYSNNSIEYGTLDAIAKGIPISFEQAYIMIKYYLGGEDKQYIEKQTNKKTKIKYLDNETFNGIKNMCNKYLKIAKGDFDFDEEEEFIMFTIENKISPDILLDIIKKNKIREGKYKEVLEIYKKLP